jgi:fucose permease
MRVAAIFFHVGAEAGVSAGIPLFLEERFDIDISKVGLLGLFAPNGTLAVASFFLVGRMVTAIVDGAILPPLMGLLADSGSVQLSFPVPLAALLYIAWTALDNRKPAGA